MLHQRIWLLIGVSLVIAVTLAPFETFFSTFYLSDRIAAIFGPGDTLAPAKCIGHLASFFLVGVLVAAVYKPEDRPGGFVRLLAPAIIGCLLLETAQFFQFGRHARALDVILNVIGYGVGLWLAGWSETGRRWRNMLESAAERRPYAEIGIASAALFAWWILGLQPALGSLRMDWKRDCSLSMGNEVRGMRPWLGELRYCGLYGRALNARHVAALHAERESADNLKTRVQDGLLIGYDFRRIFGRTVPSQGVLSSPKYDLIVPFGKAVRSTPNGLQLQEPTALQAAEPIAGLTDNIVSSHAFSVEAWITSQTTVQSGPACLITFSNFAGLHNFTLGQQMKSLVFRVRNRFSSVDESQGENEAPGVIDSVPTHFVAVYDHGVSNIYRDGKHRETIDLREPFYYSHLPTGPVARVAFFMLAIVTIAWPLFGLIARRYPVRVAIVIAAISTFAVCSLPYLLSCAIVGGVWLPNFFCWLAASLLLVYPAGIFYVLRPASAGQAREVGKMTVAV